MTTDSIADQLRSKIAKYDTEIAELEPRVKELIKERIKCYNALRALSSESTEPLKINLTSVPRGQRTRQIDEWLNALNVGDEFNIDDLRKDTGLTLGSAMQWYKQREIVSSVGYARYRLEIRPADYANRTIRDCRRSTVGGTRADKIDEYLASMEIGASFQYSDMDDAFVGWFSRRASEYIERGIIERVDRGHYRLIRKPDIAKTEEPVL
jgi:hypothetical protein